MHSNIRERARSEAGFTLIELLVVMIIIAILMAVAVPTFLSQKNSALKTQATANIKQVITAIESCAAQIPTGGYVEGTFDCSTKATLENLEASLVQLQIQATAPTNEAQTQVVLGEINQGFMVQKRIMDSGSPVYYAEIHRADGNIYKLCGAAAFAYTSTTSSPVGTSKTCKKPGSATLKAW